MEKPFQKKQWRLGGDSLVNYINKNTSYTISQESIMLANQARTELLKNGYVSVICPKCQEHPKITMTSRGERTIISCACGYVKNIEINL